jgi:hypothetical protein
MNESNGMFRIAVVGHTNAGKTSLMRTLARDAEFGEVSPSPATTREVTSITLLADNKPVADFRDTPGLEDSIGLLEFIDGLRTDRRDDGPSLVERFLGTAEADGPFAHEAKALRQARTADLVLYVVDARDRVLPRYQDELELLARCGRPVLPVMNFVADDSARAEEWRDALARLGLHAAANFDTIVYDAEDEKRLFEAMRVLVEPHRDAINALIEEREVRRKRSIDRATRAVAELLIDAAAYMKIVDPSDSSDSSDSSNDDHVKETVVEAELGLQQALREHERLSHRAIFSAFEFADDNPDAALLECTEGRLGVDLFSQEALRQSGLGAATGAAGGAATGAVIDLAVGGMSLGAAAAIGAIVGGFLGTTAAQSRRLVRRARGGDELRAGDTTLRLLLARSMDLSIALLHRGHADTDRIALRDRVLSEDFVSSVLKALKRARSHPSWSGVGRTPSESGGRRALIRQVASLVHRQVMA